MRLRVTRTCPPSFPLAKALRYKSQIFRYATWSRPYWPIAFPSASVRHYSTKTTREPTTDGNVAIPSLPPQRLVPVVLTRPPLPAAASEQSSPERPSTEEPLTASSSYCRLIIRHCQTPNSSIDWIDVTSHPATTLEDYKTGIMTFFQELGVSELIGMDGALDTMLLPQTISLQNGTIGLVVRVASRNVSPEQDSIQELTNRLTVLIFEDHRVVTIHRIDVEFIRNIRDSWHSVFSNVMTKPYLLNLLVKRSTQTFQRALADAILLFDKYEASLFAPREQRPQLSRNIYHVKRRAAVYHRLLSLQHDAFSHCITLLKHQEEEGRAMMKKWMAADHAATGGSMPHRFRRYHQNHPSHASNRGTVVLGHAPSTASAGVVVASPQQLDAYFHNVLQHMEDIRSLSDELNETANAVLQLLFQLSSYQLNDLMRVLTMFSAVFIPLTFMSGIYGMNFESLPLLNHPQGHWVCFGVMSVMSGGLLGWFRWRKYW